MSCESTCPKSIVVGRWDLNAGQLEISPDVAKLPLSSSGGPTFETTISRKTFKMALDVLQSGMRIKTGAMLDESCDSR
jgi:hypothetical protein